MLAKNPGFAAVGETPASNPVLRSVALTPDGRSDETDCKISKPELLPVVNGQLVAQRSIFGVSHLDNQPRGLDE